MTSLKSSEVALNIATIMDEVERSTKAITGMIGDQFITDRTAAPHSIPRSEAARAENMACGFAIRGG